MRTRFFTILIIIFVVNSSASIQNNVDALSCGIPPFVESFQRHDLLLHGILIEKIIDRADVDHSFGTPLSTLVFDTITVYKGEHQDRFTIKANLSWDDFYVQGAEYVIFADKDGDSYLRELCVGQYIAFPQILQFLDAYPLNITSGIGIHSLNDLVTGDDKIRLENLWSRYTDINRGNSALIKMKSLGNEYKFTCDFETDLKQSEEFLKNNYVVSKVREDTPNYAVSIQSTLDTNPQTGVITFDGDNLTAEISVLNGKEFDSCFYVYNSKLINKNTGEIEVNRDQLSAMCNGEEAYLIIPDLCPNKISSTIQTMPDHGGGYVDPECQKGHELENGICQSVNYNYVEGGSLNLDSKLSPSYTVDYVDGLISRTILPVVGLFVGVMASFLVPYFILKRKNIPSRPYVVLILACVLLFFGIPNLVSSLEPFSMILSQPEYGIRWIFNFQFIPRLISISIVSVAGVLLYRSSVIRKLIKK
ncbi:MAG: hypothetical protein ACW9W3_06370 [Candidatus Nitrosopumilus sp. bin_68KS]